MRKLKTKRTLLKRIKISKSGVARRRKVGLKHLKVNKNNAQKLRARAESKVASRKIRKRFKSMLGRHGKRL